MRKILNISLLLLLFSSEVIAQGFYNHQWLLGSYLFLQDPKGRIVFDSSSYTHIPEFRKMVFWGTEATICDAQGDFLMSSNGVWIANANNDTMMNGSGLNPNGITSNWASGLPLTYNNVILPYPSDTNKYVLFHHTASYVGTYPPALELYYSVIDMTGDGGLGEVSLKNQIAFSDTLGWGMNACKHANGRDWWIVMIKDNSDVIFKVLFTNNGIESISTQNLGIATTIGASRQLTFSQDGSTFLCNKTDGGTVVDNIVQILDFDRCSGNFSNLREIDISDGSIGWGLAFSPNGEYVYANSSVHVFQINIDSLTVDTVATYDGFISPPNLSCCATSFWNMSLAPNGKFYITSGSGVQHLHEMNYPDSAGLACDVQQHAINLGYAQLRAVPNHPNYNLGAVVGSVCDTLSVGIEEQEYDFHFGISPNPSQSGLVKFVYLLPQNKSGELSVYSIMGQLVHKQYLSPWSSLQLVDLSDIQGGIYTCVLTSGTHRTAKKLVVIGGSGAK
jgi:hypothetical protein